MEAEQSQKEDSNRESKDSKHDSIEINQKPTSPEKPTKPVKPPKPEDKPFSNFLLEDFIPELSKALTTNGVEPISISLVKGNRPVVGGECSMIICEIPPGRRFWLAFSKDELTSNKTIALAETGAEPFLLESFLIDEKKATLSLLISRTLQRLNGQKWLGPNWIPSKYPEVTTWGKEIRHHRH